MSYGKIQMNFVANPIVDRILWRIALMVQFFALHPFIHALRRVTLQSLPVLWVEWNSHPWCSLLSLTDGTTADKAQPCHLASSCASAITMRRASPKAPEVNEKPCIRLARAEKEARTSPVRQTRPSPNQLDPQTCEEPMLMVIAITTV